VSADLTARIKALAAESGFARAGVAPAGELPRQDREATDAFLARGYDAGMDYLRRHAAKRVSPRRIVPDARSVICLAVSYAPAVEPQAGPGEATIARYARGRDYHKVLKRRCRALMDAIRAEVPDFAGRAFVDTAPVAERSLAQLAGLGWVGRNGCLIVPGLGSYVVLAEIVCNLPLAPDAPAADSCGACTACVDACPTGACTGETLVDARRCLSYLTIEHAGDIPPELRPALGGRVLGCDRCQEVCPHNAGVPPGDAELTGGAAPTAAADLAAVLDWTEADWDAATRGSARRRAPLHSWQRNAAVAAGNSGQAELVEPIRRLRDREPALAETCDWALARLGRPGGCPRAAGGV